MNKKSVYLLCLAVLIVSAIAELCGVHLHAPAWWPLPFGYNIFFGFAGCWILIIVAKLIMAPLLQRDTDYYNDDYEGRGDDDE